MSLFENLKSSADVEVGKDVLGGGRELLPSGLYDTEISMAYVDKSKSGAASVTLHLKVGEQEVRETIYITSGDAKQNKITYEKDGKLHYLPGFELFRSLCLMTLNKEPSALVSEEKVIKKWSKEAGAEVPTTVPVITELLGAKIKAGILHQIEDRQALNATTGGYEPTGETREINTVNKFFHANTGLTLAEAMAGETAGTFIKVWEEKWKGQVNDRSSKTPPAGQTGAAQSSAFGRASAAGVTQAPKKSLFGNN